jgi:hypothetical protein
MTAKIQITACKKENAFSKLLRSKLKTNPLKRNARSRLSTLSLKRNFPAKLKTQAPCIPVIPSKLIRP